MKIKVITSTNRTSQKNYKVVVEDHGFVVIEGMADNLQDRDKMVWGWAEQYGVVDIEYERDDTVIEEKDKEFRFTEIPSIPVLSEQDAEEFFESDPECLYTRITVAVGEGVQSGRRSVRMFELNGTGQYLSSDRQYWKVGLEKALNYFKGRAAYEKCAEVHRLMAQL